MNKLNAVIIDDEPDSIALLQLQLERHCPSVGAITVYYDPLQALEAIKVHPPQVLFVDVEMPSMNGFELLERLQPLTFSVIFITAYNQYAIRAFRFNALDYLLKPVDTENLQVAVERAAKAAIPTTVQMAEARAHMNGITATRIALPSQRGVSFVTLADIVYVEASNNYSKIILADGSNHLISKTLKDVQELLEESHFLRVHRQYVVNLNNVKHFNRNDGILTMDNKAELPIVRNQYDRFMEKYYKF